MDFLLIGYGRVGSRTARILTEEGHDVVLVDNDAERVERAESDGFEAVVGEGDDEAVLVDAGVADADAIGAFTPDLNVNFAACMVGDHHDCRTVLRIDEDYREEIYENYAENVDEIIYPERLGAAGAKTAMLGGDFNVVADLATNLQLTVLSIQEGSPAVGKRLSQLDLPEGARIYAHGPGANSLSIPLPGTELDAGDEVAVIAAADDVDALRETLQAEAA